MYKFEQVDRSSLFYNQYRYCVTIYLHESGCLRYLDSVGFERAIKNARYWAMNDRWTDRTWTQTKEIALRETRDVLMTETEPFKTVVSFNIVCIYTNHLGLTDRILNLENEGIELGLVREAVISKPAGVVLLRESKYAYRTYFRERKFSRNQRDMLLNFFNSRQDTLRPCESLITWLKNKQAHFGYNPNYSKAHFFVDHDHPNEGTMLSLVMPGIVRKTMPIETTK